MRAELNFEWHGQHSYLLAVIASQGRVVMPTEQIWIGASARIVSATEKAYAGFVIVFS